jgi:ferredoxin--NADP+ reductase
MAEPRRIAIVGAGPSGIFAAQALSRQQDVEVSIDLYDRLPTPYGLLRYGVAPDHTSIKGVADTLARVFESAATRFVGLVEFGTDISRADLLGAYDAVIYAVGAADDVEMAIPGEQLPGSESARAFVAWYSGHPDAAAQRLRDVRTAVMVGVGNVAVDVARILSRSADELDATDMPGAVLDELREHRIADIWVVGRRGPENASFTTPELRELLAIEGVQPIVYEPALVGVDEEGLDRRQRANLGALRDAAGRVVEGAPRRLHLLFWARPVRIEGTDRVEAVVVEGTRLDEDGRVVGTGVERRIESQLVLRAIGYRARALAGVPFDPARHVIPHVLGRVTDGHGIVQPREYVVGWIKRGPTGVIGTNKSDAAETVAGLLEDLAAPPVPLEPVSALWLRLGLRPTSYEDWARIDAAESALGESYGRARTKIESWSDLLEIARSARRTRRSPEGGSSPVDGAVQNL